MAFAAVCTCYAVTSCRFFSLDYQSKYGDFDNYFYYHETEHLTTHHVGVGLFTWLRPFNTVNWKTGHCAGYNQLQRQAVLDEIFDVVRILSIFAVLCSVSLFLFTLSISCLAFNNIQRCMMVICAGAVAALTGSAFLITRSGLCTGVGQNPSCSIDQGGFAAIAGVGLWILVSFIGIFSIKTVEPKLSAKEKGKQSRERRLRQLEMIKELESFQKEDKRATLQSPQKFPSTSSSRTSNSSIDSQTHSPGHSRSPSEFLSRTSPKRQLTATGEAIQEKASKRANLGNEIKAVASIIQARRQCENEEIEVAIRPSLQEYDCSIGRELDLSFVESRLKDDDMLLAEFERVAQELGIAESPSREKSTGNEMSASRGDAENPAVNPNEATYFLPHFLTRDISNIVDEHHINRGGLEVYLTETLDRIDAMIEEENPNYDPYMYEV